MNLFENFLYEINLVFKNGVLGVSLIDIGIIVASILFALLIRGLVAKILVNKVKVFVLKTGNKIDDKLFDSLLPPFRLLPIVLVFLTITLYFDIDSTLGVYFQKINNTLSTVFVFWLIHQMLIPFSNTFGNLEKLLSKGLFIWILKSLKYLIIFLGIVAVLEVWGIKIGPVIAGLGLFGVAVALGAQDLFKNLISGILIILEKRFEISDVIEIPDLAIGTVEHIGFRSTLVRKFNSTPITIPNYVFSDSSIINYSKRKHRRINWIVGLTYDSTTDQLKKICEEIKNYIDNSPDFIVNDQFPSFNRIEKFNDSSIDLLICAFTRTNDWPKFLKVRESLLIEIKSIVENHKCSFAFPSQTIYIEKND
ncbi:mechanosensitive ion channel family protein [Alphaproteobacteria bacterium]|nr:mechanosensitive ion channel family protein [Alphaproteobacteria bacterium]